jgi:hypothetical protein
VYIEWGWVCWRRFQDGYVYSLFLFYFLGGWQHIFISHSIILSKRESNYPKKNKKRIPLLDSLRKRKHLRHRNWLQPKRRNCLLEHQNKHLAPQLALRASRPHGRDFGWSGLVCHVSCERVLAWVLYVFCSFFLLTNITFYLITPSTFCTTLL